MRKRFGQAVVKQTDESLHEARIATKQLRYVMELADAGGMKRCKPELKFLKGVQELLGEHHDVHVILAVLEKRVTPTATWQKWRQAKEQEQAERAASFFAKSCQWLIQPLVF